MQRAMELAECVICFDDLCCQPCAGLFGTNSSKTCRHIFHASCVGALTTNICPTCRTPFQCSFLVPNPLTDAESWFRFVDADGNGSLSFEEVLDALKCQIPLNWQKLECDSDRLWSRWDKDGNGQISLREFSDPNDGLLTYIRQHYSNQQRGPPPNIRSNKLAWFMYWDEDRSGTLEKTEVVRALMKSFRIEGRDTASISSVIENIWPIFDFDMSGRIDKNEFIAPDGLADTVIATLNATGR